jgi:RimJ/RimL family protein N-acetyltransferase
MLASDGPDLVEAAADGALWNLAYTFVPSTETVDDYIRIALEGRADGTAIPFVTQLLESKRIIGSTRFCKIDWEHRKLEIGWTWLAKSWQRTFVNTEAKLLMLTFAFERLNCVRVQFMTDELNETSCAAVLRLGAKQEGIVRHDLIMAGGRKRDSVQFSIIDEEWPAVRRKLDLSQEAFASEFSFSIAQIRDWEQGRSRPIGGVRAYLMMIECNPKGVLALLRSVSVKRAA